MFDVVDTAIADNRRRLADHCAGHYHAMSVYQICLSARCGTGFEVNGIPVHLGTIVLLYADTSLLMSLARRGAIRYLTTAFRLPDLRGRYFGGNDE